jgi:hypothetical protein
VQAEGTVWPLSREKIAKRARTPRHSERAFARVRKGHIHREEEHRARIVAQEASIELLPFRQILERSTDRFFGLQPKVSRWI